METLISILSVPVHLVGVALFVAAALGALGGFFILVLRLVSLAKGERVPAPGGVSVGRLVTLGVGVGLLGVAVGVDGVWFWSSGLLGLLLLGASGEWRTLWGGGWSLRNDGTNLTNERGL
jgi:hypothetical protein